MQRGKHIVHSQKNISGIQMKSLNSPWQESILGLNRVAREDTHQIKVRDLVKITVANFY